MTESAELTAEEKAFIDANISSADRSIPDSQKYTRQVYNNFMRHHDYMSAECAKWGCD